MKTSIVTMCLIAASLAFAAPAAAQCVDSAETGTYACASLDDPSWRTIDAYQNGVGGAGYSQYEYTFWGMTYRGTNAYAYTAWDSPAGGNYAAFNEFCMVQGDQCAYQDDSVVYYGTLGFAYVGISQYGGERVLCYGTDAGWDCVPF